LEGHRPISIGIVVTYGPGTMPQIILWVKINTSTCCV